MFGTHHAKAEISVVQLEQVYIDTLMMCWVVDVGELVNIQQKIICK